MRSPSLVETVHSLSATTPHHISLLPSPDSQGKDQGEEPAEGLGRFLLSQSGTTHVNQIGLDSIAPAGHLPIP